MLKSTQIVIEQLFIGLFFFLILVGFIFDWNLLPDQMAKMPFNEFAFGIFIVIAAYASGVVIDRWSDTILERLYSINRIKTISKKLTYSDLNWYVMHHQDPYPEACLRMEIYGEGNGIAEQHDYLRTRMRITRAITCLVPAFFISIQSQIAGLCPQNRYKYGLLTLSIYAAIVIAAIQIEKIHSKENRNKSGGKKLVDKFKYQKIPKTHNIGEYKNFVRNNDSNGADKDPIVLKIGIRSDPSIIGLGILAFLSTTMAIKSSSTEPAVELQFILAPLGLILITLLVGRAWWRISKTFFTFLYNFKSYHFSKNCQNVKAISIFNPDKYRQNKNTSTGPPGIDKQNEDMSDKGAGTDKNKTRRPE